MPRSVARSALIGGAGGCAIVLAACSPTEPGTPAPAATRPAVAVTVEGIPPEPDPATAQAYIAALNRIDPDIVHGKPDKAIDRGRNQCSSVHDGHDEARLVDLTNQRFTSPDHPEGFGPAVARQILDEVRTYLCP